MSTAAWAALEQSERSGWSRSDSFDQKDDFLATAQRGFSSVVALGTGQHISQPPEHPRVGHPPQRDLGISGVFHQHTKAYFTDNDHCRGYCVGCGKEMDEKKHAEGWIPWTGINLQWSSTKVCDDCGHRSHVSPSFAAML